MDAVVFTSYLNEIEFAAHNSDPVKLLVQLDFMNELTPEQQRKATSFALSTIPEELFLKIFQLLSRDHKRLTRLNDLAEMIFVTLFKRNSKLRDDALRTSDLNHDKMRSIFKKCGIELNDLSEIKEVEEPDARTALLKKVRDLSVVKNDESAWQLQKCMGTDPGIDILIINALSVNSTDVSIEILVEELNNGSSRIRNYALSKLEHMGLGITRPVEKRLTKSLLKKEKDISITLFKLLADVGTYHNYSFFLECQPRIAFDSNVEIAFYETAAKLFPDTFVDTFFLQLADTRDVIAFNAISALNQINSEGVYKQLLETLSHCRIGYLRMAELCLFGGADSLIERFKSNSKMVGALNELCLKPGMEKYRKKYNIVIGDEEIAGLSKHVYKIWAVDDSKLILHMYERVGVELGSELRTFETGTELLSKLEKFQPDIVFIDLNMPDMDGLEVARHINKTPWAKTPKVLVTSQGDFAGDTEITYRLFNKVIQKPFTVEILRETIEQLI